MMKNRTKEALLDKMIEMNAENNMKKTCWMIDESIKKNKVFV